MWGGTGVISCTMDLGPINLLRHEPEKFPLLSLRKSFVRAGRSGFLFSETVDKPETLAGTTAISHRQAHLTGGLCAKRGRAHRALVCMRAELPPMDLLQAYKV